VILSYLPLAHIMAFVVHYATLLLGCRIGYGSPRTLTSAFVRNCDGDIKELKPTILVAVPTVLERIKKGVERKIASSKPMVQKLFKFAYAMKEPIKKAGGSTPILDAIVFNKLKAEIGGRLKLMVSGGAYLAPEVQLFMQTCFNVTVCQGYGLTETCGPTSLQETTDPRIGTGGAPFPSIEVKLVDVPEMGYLTSDKPQPRGELWVRGNSVTSGYFKNPEETKKVFTSDGWFKTGDVGSFTPEGTIQIVDRVKNLIKPPHGEYIAVERLESIYRDVPCVEQILVYVDSTHNEVLGVVVPQRDTTIKFAEENNLDVHDFGKLTHDPKVQKWVLSSLQDSARKKGLKSIEMIRNVHIVSDEWTPDNGFLTAAGKVKRAVIAQNYKKEIDQMYADIASKSDE